MDEKFFLGYRKTAIKPEEVLVSILIPYTHKVKNNFLTSCLLLYINSENSVYQYRISAICVSKFVEVVQELLDILY